MVKQVRRHGGIEILAIPASVANTKGDLEVESKASNFSEGWLIKAAIVSERSKFENFS